jgi:hypothetical protein
LPRCLPVRRSPGRCGRRRSARASDRLRSRALCRSGPVDDLCKTGGFVLQAISPYEPSRSLAIPSRFRRATIRCKIPSSTVDVLRAWPNRLVQTEKSDLTESPRAAISRLSSAIEASRRQLIHAF